jgi:hypothetical protein
LLRQNHPETEELNNKIMGVSEEEENPYSKNVTWNLHIKGYALLHILRSTIKQVGEDFLDLKKKNLDLEKKINRLEKKTTA